MAILRLDLSMNSKDNQFGIDEPVPFLSIIFFLVVKTFEFTRKTAIAAITPGIAIARKFMWCGRFKVSKAPVSTGPTIAPIRPIPDAQPMPVERIELG